MTFIDPNKIGNPSVTPEVRLRLAQEFEVNQEFLPSKASVYLKRVGENINDYWSVSNTVPTVIDATNFSTIDKVDTEGNVIVDTDVQKIVASDIEQDAWFGYSVSISGDYAIVGAERKNELPGTHLGAAYIFYRDPDNPSNNWNQVKKLVASDAKDDDHFGTSVSISGDYAIVGADAKNEPPADDNEGAAYIFYRDPDNPSNNWNQVKKITASDSEQDARFGTSVSISGDYVIVGANGKNELPVNDDEGAVYIFYRDPDNPSNNWNQVKKIVASDPEQNAFFGVSVSISGDYAIVGANGMDDIIEEDAGAAYIFYRDPDNPSNNWNEIKKLVASDRGTTDRFGISVSISGDYVVVGANLEDGDIGAEGASYIFYKDQGGTNNWGEVKKIVASDREANAFFGWSVSISGNYIVVGAYQDLGSSGLEVGASYIFYKDQGGVDNWGQVKKIVASDPEEFASFGWSVAIDGNNIISGAFRKNEPPADDNEGAAYIFGIETTFEGSNIIIFDDRIEGFTGNGYMLSLNDFILASDFGVINYPLKAAASDTFTLWIRYSVPGLDSFDMEILIDGNISKTIDEITFDPSSLDWRWLNTTLVLPDTGEHILGIKIKDKDASIDKIVIDPNNDTHSSIGPDYGVSPYLTNHMKVYDSIVSGTPNSPLIIYDYKNSITEVVQDDWYNFNISILDSNYGYTSVSDFSGDYFLVMSCTGSSTDNFVVWELLDNDEYNAPSSAMLFDRN